MRNDPILSIQTGFTMLEQMILRDKVQIWLGIGRPQIAEPIFMTVHLGHLVTKLTVKKQGDVCVCVCVSGGGRGVHI